MLSRYGTSGEKRDISLYIKVFRLINGLDDAAEEKSQNPSESLEENAFLDALAVPESENAEAAEKASEVLQASDAEAQTETEPDTENAAQAESIDEPVPEEESFDFDEAAEDTPSEGLSDAQSEQSAQSIEEALESIDPTDGPTSVFIKNRSSALIFTDDLIKLVTIVSSALCAAMLVFSVVISAFRINLRPDKIVYISDDGSRLGMYTNEDTVSGFLSSKGISLSFGDELSADPDDPINDGMLIAIDRAITVFVSSKDEISAHRVSGGTVGDALEEIYGASIPASVTTPSKDSILTSGMLITIDEVTKKIVTQSEVIPYSQVTVRDPDILRGNTEIKQQGVDGKLEVTYEVTYINGQEVSRFQISRVTALEPIEQIVHRGVKDPATPKPTQKKTSSPKKTSEPKKTTDPKKTFSPSQKAELSSDKSSVTIGGKTYKIAYSYEVMATAYTHTGNKTASGKWPEVGMMAVDRSIFPFGTKAYVPGYGIAVAEDVGGFRGDQIDLFMDTYEECINWGRKRGLTIYILE